MLSIRPLNLPGPENLSLPTKEEVDNLEAASPVRVYRVSILHPSLTVHSHQAPVSLEAGLQSLDILHQAPMYPLRNVRAGCLMHPPSRTILSNCHTNTSISLLDTWVKLVNNKESTRLLSLDKATLSFKTLLYQNFWKNIYQKLGEAAFKIETLQVDFSLAQILCSVVCVTSVSHNLSNELFDEILKDSKASSQPIVSTVLNGFQANLSWTKEIYTAPVSLIGINVSVKGFGKTGSVPIFNGFCEKSSRNVSLSSCGQSPGKALLDVPASKYLSGTLQWPCQTLPHPVPTVIHLKMGQSSVLFDPILMEILLFSVSCYNTYTKKSIPQTESGVRSIKSEDIPDNETLNEEVGITALQCLTGALVDVKIGETSLYLSERSLASVSSGRVSVTEVVHRAARAAASHHLVRLTLGEVRVSNANTRLDLAPYTQHPILFPQSVWTAGKVNFPWSWVLASFSASLVGPSYVTEILLPVNTNCSLGSAADDVTKSLAIHVDMSSVQFILTSSIMTSLAQISQTFLSALMEAIPASDTKINTSTTKVTQNTSSQHLVQRSLGSLSEPATATATSVLSRGSGSPDEAGQWSLWLQWAIPQCSVTLAAERSELATKVEVTLEDTSISLDKQASYTKLKLRVRSVAGKHLESVSGGSFQPKNFPDHMICCQPDLLQTLYVYNPESSGVEILSDEDDIDINKMSKGVFNMTVTKAKCHSLIKKLKTSKDTSIASDDTNRYLSEFDFEINPIDFFLESSILDSVLTVFYPLSSIRLLKKENPNQPSNHTDSLIQLNNNNLPMLYFKAERIRVFLLGPDAATPASDAASPASDDLVPNFLLLQVGRASVTSQVENPLKRILVEAGLYHQASHSRLLGVPGSPLEDRQYQVMMHSSSLNIETCHSRLM